MTEVWKDIKGYEGLYQVSSIGRVRSLDRTVVYSDGREYFYESKILIPYKNNSHYLMVNLCKNGKSKSYLIHRLVAEAFIPNTENKKEIDHINTNKSDNRVDNLRWVTRKENCNNPISIENNRNAQQSKPILQLDLNGHFINKWKSVREVEREIGYIHNNISRCCNGKYKTAYGYIWKYYDIELYLESKLFKAFNIKNKMVA